jgi:hypothetical protein
MQTAIQIPNQPQATITPGSTQSKISISVLLNCIQKHCNKQPVVKEITDNVIIIQCEPKPSTTRTTRLEQTNQVIQRLEKTHTVIRHSNAISLWYMLTPFRIEFQTPQP